MKTIIGAAIGVFAVGLVLIGIGLRGTASTPAALVPASTVLPGNATLVPVGDAGARAAAAGPVMVNCGPGQRALVRQTLLNGEPVSQVACVADLAGVAADDAAPGAMVRRVTYEPSASRVVERRVVYQEPVARRVEQPKRSWQKRLLVIGGSTAAGAGVGGIVGGKKGALIGAALGGGASTLYEATRR